MEKHQYNAGGRRAKKHKHLITLQHFSLVLGRVLLAANELELAEVT